MIRLQKAFKSIIVVVSAILLFSGSIFLSAYFANFVVNVQNVDVTLGSLESSNTEFSVSFDPLSPPGAGNESYHIAPSSVCNLNQYDDYGNCLDPVPNLCPYISLQPQNGEATEIGFTQNPSGAQAVGQLNNPDDLTDTWNLSVKSPCFEGECPADYDESQNGAPLPQSQKGQTFKCDLFTETNDVPEIVKNYLNENVAYADTLLNSIEVSAVFTGELSGCTVDCFSNVLFLPGIMGSRLYEKTGNGPIYCGPDLTGSGCFYDKELWVSTSDSSQANLTLNNQGKSINNIYTKNDTQKLNGDGDETGIVDDVYNANIYQSFIADLKKWKDDDKVIEDYAFIPYDWRLSLDDVITNGSINTDGNLAYDTAQNFSESFILKKLEALQSNSRSGKVTIIAHSNGGLVAKALIQKLKDTNNPLYDKIDKVILVAVPQVGTPDAFIGLLHGSDLGHGFIMDADRSRQLSENMPTVYNLLPSAGYFTTVDPAFAVDKLASFENIPFFNPQTSQYGLYISNESELKDYILGSDSRIKPSFSDTVHPNIGNSTLYTQAENVHQILDNWQPSPDTKVIQVAGWGEETLAGLDYIAIRDTTEHLSYKPRHVVDGDGTVVVPSALWMSDASNIERWWVDLKKYNKNNFANREHRDILEIPILRDFIKSSIEGVDLIDLDKIIVNNTSTLISNGVRLHYTLHSPLTLGITDAQGRYTGQDPITKEIKEEIPNVTYKRIGDVQFISAPEGVAYTLEMNGYEQRSFAVDVDRQEGNNITDSTSFQGIPSSTTTIATIDVPENFEISNSTLKIDQNGDGTVDKTLQATPDGVTVYDITPPELQATFDINNKNVVFSAQDNSDPNPTINVTNTSVTLTDNAGNTTIIPFTKFKEKPHKLKLSFNNIVRNGVSADLHNIFIEYNWKEPHGILTDLDTKVVIKGVEKYMFRYNKSQNITIIKEKINNHIQTKVQHGFVVVTVKTEGDGVKVSY